MMCLLLCRESRSVHDMLSGGGVTLTTYRHNERSMIKTGCANGHCEIDLMSLFDSFVCVSFYLGSTQARSCSAVHIRHTHLHTRT